MAFASQPMDAVEPLIEIHRSGSVVQSRPGVPHNVYLPAGARIHTVKIGATSQSDWRPEPALDALVNDLSETELLRNK